MASCHVHTAREGQVAYPRRVLGGKDLSNATAAVVADEIHRVDAKCIEKLD